MISGKVKDLRSGAEAKASVKSTVESLIIYPKPGKDHGKKVVQRYKRL